MNNEPTFLRPSFTAKIATYLQKGFKVNVYSEEKQGLQQLIEDLRQSCPENTHFIRLNMRSHAHSFESYLMALSEALHLRTSPQNLRTALVEYLDQHPEQCIQLCLENFDQLSEKQIETQKVDKQGYNLDFLTHLNSFGNNPRIALLFTSSRLLNTQELYIGGTRVRGSKIDVRYREHLPKLDFSEIEAYLQKIAPPRVVSVLDQKPPFYTVLVAEIAKHNDPAGLMHFIADSLPVDAALSIASFQGYMAHWKNEYAKQHQHSTDLLLNDWSKTTRHWVRRALRLVGIGKDLSLAHRLLRGFVAVLLLLILPFWGKVMQIGQWLYSLILNLMES